MRKGTKRSIKKMPDTMLSTLRAWHSKFYDFCNKTGAKWVLNIDETPVCFGLSFNTTFSKKGSIEVIIESDNSKKRVTLLLEICMRLDGTATKKCLPLLIVSGTTTHVFKDVDNDDSIILAANKKAWRTEPEYAVYIMDCITQEVKKEGCVAVWDNFSVHCTAGIKKLCAEEGLHVMELPANATPFIQPLDVALNKTFKTGLKNKYSEWRIDHTRDRVGRNNIYQWSKQVWNEIGDAVIKKAFLCCGFGRVPVDLSDKNTYWLALPSLRRDVEEVAATNGNFTTMLDQRTLTDQSHQHST